MGTVTGLVDAAGGLGGFFPPLAVSFLYDLTTNHTLGFILLSLTSLICTVLLRKARN